MSRRQILVQLDTDPQPSVFDSVVATDAGAEQLFRHGGITAENVVPLVHGAMFTRGPDELRATALFIGGSDVAAADAVFEQVRRTFFGPLRCSIMLDPNGANTTAAAAVLAARKHLPLAGARVAVLAATGPVGQRVVRLLAREQADVVAVSRSFDRAKEVARRVAQRVPEARITPRAAGNGVQVAPLLADVQVVIAAGAAGVELLPQTVWTGCQSLKVAIDVNAVPPAGIGGVDVQDRGKERGGVACYGALGVGGTKMKIHKAGVRSLFEANDRVLDAEELLEIGKTL